MPVNAAITHGRTRVIAPPDRRLVCIWPVAKADRFGGNNRVSTGPSHDRTATPATATRQRDGCRNVARPAAVRREAFRASGLSVPRTIVTSTLPVRSALLATGRYLSMVPGVVIRFPVKH